MLSADADPRLPEGLFDLVLMVDVYHELARPQEVLRRLRASLKPDGRLVLVETLKGKGPLTVFAPTDEAFAKLPAGTLEALLKDKAKLTAVLTYHVLPDKVMAADVVKLKGAKTVQGQMITIDTFKGVKVDGANVVKTDIVCSNGVIHVIDSVILPK